MNECLLRKTVAPLYAQIQVFDGSTAIFPEWETGDEAVVHSTTALCVSTRPDHEGDVDLIIECGPDAASRHLLFQGLLHVPSSTLSIGSFVGNDISTIDLGDLTVVRAAIYGSPGTRPERVTVVIAPS